MASRPDDAPGPRVLWRICDRRHPPFDGQGAALWGGRWNSPGRLVVYASMAFSTALLECLARTARNRVPKNQVAYRITLPHDLAVERAGSREIPRWDQREPATRAFGDRWLEEARTVVLLVPSIVARQDWNAVINPAHEDFRRLVIAPPVEVHWDSRLFH